MRGIVNIVVDNGLFLKLITVATYTIHIENDFATPNIQLFSVKWLPVHTALFSGDFSWFCSFDHNDKIETQCG